MSKTGVPLKMVGEDGNAFAILGRAQKALRRAGKGDLVEQFHQEATGGDYNHLLRTCLEWFDVDVDEDQELCNDCREYTADIEGLCEDCHSVEV